jgi:hypothetical protein
VNLFGADDFISTAFACAGAACGGEATWALSEAWIFGADACGAAAFCAFGA